MSSRTQTRHATIIRVTKDVPLHHSEAMPRGHHFDRFTRTL